MIFNSAHRNDSHLAPVHATPEEFKNAAITGHFEIVFEENSGREIT